MTVFNISYDIDVISYEHILEEIKSIPIKNEGLKCASFGCGYKQIWPNWMLYDKYFQHPQVINIDMCDNDLESDSFDVVFSSHSLEHNCFHLAKKTILNWKRILKTGGVVHLAVPDLENIMKIMLDERTTFEQRYDWYMYTLFGYQVSTELNWKQRTVDDEIDPGQIHYCSFTKEWLSRFFSENGFQVEQLVAYDGYATPSLYLKARKT